MIAAVKQIAYQDAVDRNPMEGKFSEGKREYCLDRIVARFQETSETVISLQLLVMNLEKVLWDTFLSIFSMWMRPLRLQDASQSIMIFTEIMVVQETLVNFL